MIRSFRAGSRVRNASGNDDSKHRNDYRFEVLIMRDLFRRQGAIFEVFTDYRGSGDGTFLRNRNWRRDPLSGCGSGDTIDPDPATFIVGARCSTVLTGR